MDTKKGDWTKPKSLGTQTRAWARRCTEDNAWETQGRTVSGYLRGIKMPGTCLLSQTISNSHEAARHTPYDVKGSFHLFADRRRQVALLVERGTGRPANRL